MASMSQDFISSLGRPVCSFPPGLRQTYAEVMQQFAIDPDAQGFDQISTQEGFTDPTLRGVAHRMHWWFPTHFFKFQESLLLWEQQCRKAGKAFLLDRPKVTFVDLGCGAGAASAAILSALEQYQCFCRSNGAGIDPIEVKLIALDPAPLEVDIYKRLISAYAARIENYQIRTSIQTICDGFPHGTPRIIAHLSQLHGHVLIVGMSNLINWIWSEYDEYLSQDRLTEIADLRPHEAEALHQLAEQTDFDTFHVIGTAVQTKRFKFLGQKLWALLMRLLATLKFGDRPFGDCWRVKANVVFENPEGSRWVRDRPYANSSYYVESLLDIAPAFAQDSRLHCTLSPKSLEAAWAKVRCYMRYESLADEVELKLFENDVESNLRRLQATCLDRYYPALNIEHHLPYEFPKTVKETRPRSLPRLEEQIAATAVIINSSKELEGPCPEVSYSNRLASADTEFLYEYWFAAYRRYLGDALRSLDRNFVLNTDIKSFYVNIRQATLTIILQKRLRSSSRCCELLASMINRDCRASHTCGYGLLQGHALSGLLANVMLQPVDERLVNSQGLRGRYFRFTDDITVTRTTGPGSNTESILQRELSDHDGQLELNINKTHYFNEREFKKHNSGSRQFDVLGARFRSLLLPVFLVNNAYRREFRGTDWNFIYEYQKLLGEIGVYFSPEWLHRKLDEYGKLHHQLRTIGRRWRLHWPSFSLTACASGKHSWLQDFRSKNSAWMAEKRELREQLTFMFVGAARQLIAGNLSETDVSRCKRAVKFALYRLSVFGVGDASSDVVQLLLGQPWHIPVGIACQALARSRYQEELRMVFQKSTSSYVRAMALRSLGKIRTDLSISLLVSALDGGTSDIERLMASEALLDANLWQSIPLDTIQRWIRAESDHPYTQKNMILILGQACPDKAHAIVRGMDQENLHPIVHQAIHYVLTKPVAENLLWKAEPKVLRKYRAKAYPIIEELLEDRGSYAVVS